MAILEYVFDSAADAEAAEVVARVETLHQEIVDDPASSLLALATSAITLDSVRTAALAVSTFSDTFASGAVSALADTAGFLVGGAGGISGAMVVGFTTSSIVASTT